jgi:arylsulfatase A-like enzyme
VRVKDEGKLTEDRHNQRRELVFRFTLVGATIGLLVGLFEAALLFSTPRIPTLLEPDVRFVIWFLAPPTDLILFGLLGSALGWVAARWKRSSPRRNATMVAAIVGVAGAYVASAVTFLHVRAGDVLVFGNLTVPAIWFVVVFGYALFVVQAFRPRAASLFDLQTPWPLRSLARALAITSAISMLGIAFYLASRWTRLPPAEASAYSDARRPNIVLITLDTVRADHLSAYGYHRPTTPNLDRLATLGVLFENAVAPTPWTLATHASLFTGLLPHQHGADWAVPLYSGPRTLADVLKSQGYETAGFTANLYYGQAGWGMSRGFEVYEDDSFSLRTNIAATFFSQTVAQPLYQHLVRYDHFPRRNAREVNNDVFRWFRHRSSRPYFLFINYFDAHDPYLAPPPFDTRFGRLTKSVVRVVNSIDGVRVRRPLHGQDQESLIAGYDNSLAFLDDQVAQLMQFLAASPDWGNTIVIITADHGEAFGEHVKYGHGWNAYREVLHVPLIIFGPGIPAGLRVAHIARIHEIFPTVLDLALEERPPFRRTSLRRFWTPGFRPEPFDDMAVSALIPNLQGPERKAYITLMTGEWHYLEDSRGSAELYHWATDPQEKTNLIESPEHQGTVRELRARLREQVGFSVRPWRGSEYLSALDQPGYIFLHEIGFAREWQAQPPSPQLRTGFAQSALGPGDSPSRRRPVERDEDLLRSLPYH